MILLGGLLGAACRSDPGAPLPRRIVDLSPPLGREVNALRLGVRSLRFLGLGARIEFESVLPADPERAFGIETLDLPTHTGSHMDAPSRLLRGGEPPSRIALDQLVGPARLIDLRWHDRRSPIEISDLELGGITAGDAVILFLGYEPPVGDEWPLYSSLSKQAAEWLVAKQIRMLATDVPAIVGFAEIESRMQRRQPPEQVWEEYLPFFRGRVPIVAGLVNLAELMGEKQVVLVSFPLPLAEGPGAPARAAAFIY
jgi:arylformamidase